MTHTGNFDMAERETVLVACPCGWDNHGRLEIVDRYLTDWPPIPRGDGYGFLEVYRDSAHDPDDRNPTCPECGELLDPAVVDKRYP